MSDGSTAVMAHLLLADGVAVIVPSFLEALAEAGQLRDVALEALYVTLQAI